MFFKCIHILQKQPQIDMRGLQPSVNKENCKMLKKIQSGMILACSSCVFDVISSVCGSHLFRIAVTIGPMLMLVQCSCVINSASRRLPHLRNRLSVLWCILLSESITVGSFLSFSQSDWLIDWVMIWLSYLLINGKVFILGEGQFCWN